MDTAMLSGEYTDGLPAARTGIRNLHNQRNINRGVYSDGEIG